MLSASALVFSILLAKAWSAEDLSFPPGFRFGVASAAHQVEGAWNVSDKGESIWDRYSHRNPSPISEGSTADVACDSYHLWKEDINMVADLGVDFYSISISWPRLLPSGFSEVVSEDGVKYYSNLIDGLLEKGIEPILTLYHWDLPQKVQDLGGWTNPLIADWFADYARTVYSLFGNRVKTWITINEPWAVCNLYYMFGIFSSGIVSQVGTHICSKNVLMAHAKAWRIYDEEFRPKYHGHVSVANQMIWMETKNETEEATAQLVREYQGGRFAHAIYSEVGGWPPAIERVLADYSRKEGYPWSILPALSKEEIKFIKGTYDFYGLNFYNSQLVRKAREGEKFTSPHDIPLLNAKLEVDPNWPITLQSYSHVFYPEGFRKQLLWLKNNYGDIPILVTENGRATEKGLDDQDRVIFYREYLRQVRKEAELLLSIKEDGVNVTGYTAWTIMDNFEWSSGYKIKFGLYEVDFTSPNRTRTARSSAKYYAGVVNSRSLDVPYNFTLPTSKVALKSSMPEESYRSYIVFGGLVIVVTIGVTAAIVALKKKKRDLQKKQQYAAVKNGNHNGVENSDTNYNANGNSGEELRALTA